MSKRRCIYLKVNIEYRRCYYITRQYFVKRIPLNNCHVNSGSVYLTLFKKIFYYGNNVISTKLFCSRELLGLLDLLIVHETSSK